MIKAFAYDKKTNKCILRVDKVEKVEDVGGVLKITAAGIEYTVEKKPYKIRIYSN